MNKGFRLGEVEVKPAECIVVAGGLARRIEPKVMEVLLALAESGGETVSRVSLTAQVWPRGFVTDDALNRCISSLRNALGDTPREPRFVVTVPRKGYRLAMRAKPLDKAGRSRGVLVLPFQDLSQGGDSFVADALTELLIARLAVAIDQPVISRTTAMTFRNTQRDLASIGRQLGVPWVLEGSVLQFGEQVQIVAQLIDVATDTHVWTEIWTRPASDVLAVLNEISRLAAGRVRSEMQVADPAPMGHQTLSTDLLRHYLHGLSLNSRRTPEALQQAVACFERVLQEQPDYVPALSGLAQTYVLLAHYGAVPPDEGFGKAREYAGTALGLAKESDTALAHLAAVDFFFDWDFERAEQRIRRVLAINPSNDIGRVVAANIDAVMRRGERALAHIDRALEVDPLNIGLLMNSGDHLILQHRFAEAGQALSHALAIEPGFRPAQLRLAMARAFEGRKDEALACLREVRTSAGEDAAYFEFLAIALGALGETAAAAEAAADLDRLAGLRSGVTPWAQARAWAAAAETPRAIHCLRMAYETRSSSIPFLGVTPVFDRIRGLPEVRDLMERIGLP